MQRGGRFPLPVSASSSTREERTPKRSGVGAGAGPSGALLSNFNTLPATQFTFLDTKPSVVSSSSCCAHATCSTKCTDAICGDCTPCRHRLGASLLPASAGIPTAWSYSRLCSLPRWLRRWSHGLGHIPGDSYTATSTWCPCGLPAGGYAAGH
jgi:hypothetical protein